ELAAAEHALIFPANVETLAVPARVAVALVVTLVATTAVFARLGSALGARKATPHVEFDRLFAHLQAVPQAAQWPSPVHHALLAAQSIWAREPAVALQFPVAALAHRVVDFANASAHRAIVVAAQLVSLPVGADG